MPGASKASCLRCVRHSPGRQCGEALRVWRQAGCGEARAVVPAWCGGEVECAAAACLTPQLALCDKLSSSLPTCTVLLVSLFLAVPCVCRVRVCMFVCKTVSRDSLSVSFTRPGRGKESFIFDITPSRARGSWVPCKDNIS